MPRIIVRAEPSDDQEGAVLLQERVSPQDFESEHFSHQLIQRVGWAVADAREMEATPVTTAEAIRDLEQISAPGGSAVPVGKPRAKLPPRAGD